MVHGKSTLAKYLANKFNLEILHSSSETKNDLDYHIELIEKDNIVLDRANLGEIVYPLIYGREPKMTLDEQAYFMTFCSTQKVIYIIFYASNFNTLKDRLFNRGDTKQVLNNAKRLNALYRILAESYENIYSNVYTIDITEDSDQIRWFEDNVIIDEEE